MKHIKLYEEFVNEEATLMNLLIPVAVGLTVFAPWIFTIWLGTEAGQDWQNSPSWKDQYKKWKSDGAVTDIVSRLQNDEDIKRFLLLPRTKQRGQWQKLIASKLTDSEMAYLKKINKGPFYSL
jgi:hypothetical protein